MPNLQDISKEELRSQEPEFRIEFCAIVTEQFGKINVPLAVGAASRREVLILTPEF